MQDTKTYEGELVVRDSRFAIVASRFNDFIVDKLVDGAMDTLRRHGAAANDIDLAWVPGAWELPLVADKLGATGRYDAVIALGAVIRGATAHFEYVSGGVAKGLASAGEKHGLPVIFGRRDVVYAKCSDEHGVVADPDAVLKVNDKLKLVPGHCDPTCNVHDWYVGVRGGKVETLWPVSARGKAF